MAKTHWKKLYNPNYMGVYSFLEGESKELRIQSIKIESVVGRDGKAEDCTVIHWHGSEKPLICNKTNAKAIAHVVGSDYIEDWVGVTVRLITKEVRAFGDVVDAVRVDVKKVPQAKPGKESFDESHPNWKKALQAVKNGQYTVKAIQGKYQITKDALKVMQEAEKTATNEAV